MVVVAVPDLDVLFVAPDGAACGLGDGGTDHRMALRTSFTETNPAVELITIRRNAFKIP